VERQFDPKDSAFIPRAFSMTHINLTHRNWTAIGVPDFPDMSIVDPRGLVTPFFDGWSIDAWIITENFSLVPSRARDAKQKLNIDSNLQVKTVCQAMGLELESTAFVQLENNIPICHVSFKASAPMRAWLAVCIRPYNPEGISFVNDIERLEENAGWLVNGKEKVFLSKPPMDYIFSNYETGDIYSRIQAVHSRERSKETTQEINCKVGMATTAAIYPLGPHQTQDIEVLIPLAQEPIAQKLLNWNAHLEGHCAVSIPDAKIKFLYDAALRTLILHSPGEVYPGPFTYKRFWFRDASFILYAMLTAGLTRNIEKILDSYPSRQTPTGYFKSQDGEWDSNGQALWIMERYCLLTNSRPKEKWMGSIYRAIKWILRKRVPDDQSPHAGLLPPGFSAEHFGPSDYYYWDDFWSAAGLKSAAALIFHREPEIAACFKTKSDELMSCVERSLNAVHKDLKHAAVPSSPYRRMDGGAIGSLIASYPLQLWPARDERILCTTDFLMRNNFLKGCFYHEIAHSGINAYMTLHVAQVLLRAGDSKFFNIVQALANTATSTGQWPEAIHPGTMGGCMGDGQHVWAAAEWVLMVRNMFVREEEEERTLVLCSGIPEAWLKLPNTMSFGPALTAYGKVSVKISVDEEIRISWEAEWYGEPPQIEVRLVNHAPARAQEDENSVWFKSNVNRPAEKT
jgi:hypothetical protein